MSRNFLTSINLNKNELLNAAIQSLANAPVSPVTGQIYFDTAMGHLRQYDGTQWLDYLTSEQGYGYITASDSTNFNVADQTLYLNPNVTLGGSTSDYGSLTILDNTGNVTFQSGTDGGPYTIAQGYFSVAYPTNGYSAFNVDSGTAITTVRNILNATNNDNIPTVALNGNDQAIYFANASQAQTGIIQSDSSNNLTITAAINNLNLNSNNGDIYLSPDGAIYPQANIYQSNGHNITAGNNVYSKRTYIGGSDYEYDGVLDIRNAAGTLIFGVDAGAIADQGYNDYTIAGQININAQLNLNTEDGNPAGHLFTNQDGVIHLEANGDLALRAGANGNDGDIILYTGGTSGHAGKVFVGWNNDNGQYQQNEVATKGYVDSVAQGLSVLGSVLTASDVNIDLTQPLTEVGGWLLNDGERVLVKSQDDGTENGIYIYQADGGLLVPSTSQEDINLLPGAYTLVIKGTYATQGWILTQFIGQASTWTQFSAAGEYTAGNGIDITATTISTRVDNDTIGYTDGVMHVNYYANSGLATDGGLYINSGTGLTVNGSNQLVLDADNGYGVRKFAVTNEALTATSGSVSWAVTHNFGTRDVTVQLFDLDTYEQIEVDVVRTSTSVVTLSWVSDGVNADAYRVVVVG